MADSHTLLCRVIDDDLPLNDRRDAAIELNDMFLNGAPPPEGMTIADCTKEIGKVFKLVLPAILDERPVAAKKQKK